MSISGSSTTKNARLEVRLTSQQKELIERAAVYQGQSLSEFVVATAQEAAKRVLEEHELFRLNTSQSRACVEKLLNRSSPNNALKHAAKQYRQHVDLQ